MLLFIVGLLVSFPIIVLDGVMFKFMWAWHVVPVFHLEPLTVLQGAGLSILVSFVTHQIGAHVAEKRESQFYLVLLWEATKLNVSFFLLSAAIHLIQVLF